MRDFYASIADQQTCPSQVTAPAGLASGFVDICTVWFATDKNDARRCYTKHVKSKTDFKVPAYLQMEPDFGTLPDPTWIGIEVAFTLVTPWYSKDDRPFHVLDNPVRKDRVFGIPFMSAASWKGLLRWAMGMNTGLIGPEPIEDEQNRKIAEAAILHLFGNEKGASEDFRRGALAFYPTWFARVGFEVINPHSRKTRAGTQPIYYEVVPPGTQGTLRLLYAPLPGQATRDGVHTQDVLGNLLSAIDQLVTVYGFSAKRTAGWGLAAADKWVVRGQSDSVSGSRGDVTKALGRLLGDSGGTP